MWFTLNFWIFANAAIEGNEGDEDRPKVLKDKDGDFRQHQKKCRTNFMKGALTVIEVLSVAFSFS